MDQASDFEQKKGVADRMPPVATDIVLQEMSATIHFFRQDLPSALGSVADCTALFDGESAGKDRAGEAGVGPFRTKTVAAKEDPLKAARRNLAFGSADAVAVRS